ncbi:hypothetical protein PB1_03360 [Bacillus methanolicus PB1]|uniref:Uncharacterized protein n=1 Tax=Bacillus methanolicus PB1 TaxID=997296 RepID=I3E624_BACMT|nr:hypothetical protein PB1_03360 [Bacillus methanolicus PB1]
MTLELSDASSTPKAYKGTVDVVGTFKNNRAQYCLLQNKST